MKKRLHDKKAGIAILISLIIISLVELIVRIVDLTGATATTAFNGEPLGVTIIAAIIIIFSVKGKDRICYILYGAWIAYFMLDQLFELPGVIATGINTLSVMGFNPAILIGFVLRAISMVCILAIGGILVEYMHDGTIYNRAFNILSVVTVLILLCDTIIPIVGSVVLGEPVAILDTFHNLYRITMLFLFTFFAYDSAKAQLAKTNLTK